MVLWGPVNGSLFFTFLILRAIHAVRLYSQDYRAEGLTFLLHGTTSDFPASSSLPAGPVGVFSITARHAKPLLGESDTLQRWWLPSLQGVSEEQRRKVRLFHRRCYTINLHMVCQGFS